MSKETISNINMLEEQNIIVKWGYIDNILLIDLGAIFGGEYLTSENDFNKWCKQYRSVPK